MDPRSQVLLRQGHLLQGRLLLAGLPADDLLGQLPAAGAWSWQAGDQQRLAQRFGPRCHFCTTPPTGEWEGAVLFMPKSRELSDYLLRALAAELPGKPLYLVGEKRGGIEGGARHLKAFGTPAKLDSARHCQLWRVVVEQAPAAPALEALAQSYLVPLPEGPLRIHSLPGVFAHGRLDQGTRLLLEHLDDLAAGPMLDFGCGSGVLGAALQRRYPKASLQLLDNDAFALAASRLTLAANGLAAQLIAADSLAAAPGGLSAIVSNPPFHQGVHTRYEAGQALLRDAPTHLRPGGQLRLVANTFLPYQALIEQAFGNCRILAERDGFRIYAASKT